LTSIFKIQYSAICGSVWLVMRHEWIAGEARLKDLAVN